MDSVILKVKVRKNDSSPYRLVRFCGWKIARIGVKLSSRYREEHPFAWRMWRWFVRYDITFGLPFILERLSKKQ